MTQYKLSSNQPSTHFISVQTSIVTINDTEFFQLPSWRPGRYELGNFAKNVVNFKILDETNQPVIYKKTTKDGWQITTKKHTTITVSYDYFANELNAGSTFVSREQLYVNPVNCLGYFVGHENSPCKIELAIPKDYLIATSLRKENHTLFATSFDELADSPFICSNSIQHNTYTINSTTFHLWFQGESLINWAKIISDFTLFTTKQIEKFGEFPTDDYHFLFQIVSYRAYHGVEHSGSTVILLGPSHSLFDEIYSDLLGVSSHELYHTWNVKAIRPIELFPYNFTKENYSELGFLCEGVTTYMGDLFLFKSKVFTEEEYFNELNQQLQKHFDNPGRFNYSVAASSFDTWLDGYVPGVPNRKVSIYTEGCLIALVCDLMIIHHSKNQHNLDDVMRELYHEFAKKGKGVSINDYKLTLEKFIGQSLNELFENYVFGTHDYLPLLKNALAYIGLEIKITPNHKSYISIYGFKCVPNGEHFTVKSIYPNSPAENSMLELEDEIIAINNYDTAGELEKWFAFFITKEIHLLVKRKGHYHNLHLINNSSNYTYYNNYSVKKNQKLSESVIENYEHWSK